MQFILFNLGFFENSVLHIIALLNKIFILTDQLEQQVHELDNHTILIFPTYGIQQATHTLEPAPHPVPIVVRIKTQLYI